MLVFDNSIYKGSIFLASKTYFSFIMTISHCTDVLYECDEYGNFDVGFEIYCNVWIWRHKLFEIESVRGKLRLWEVEGFVGRLSTRTRHPSIFYLIFLFHLVYQNFSMYFTRNSGKTNKWLRIHHCAVSSPS